MLFLCRGCDFFGKAVYLILTKLWVGVIINAIILFERNNGMSILNGFVSDASVYPEEQNLGNIMTPLSVIDEESVAVASLCDGILICAGHRVALYRIGDGGECSYISSVEICGKARQIAVKDGYAYISARESGLYVCDLRDIENPKVVYNLDTVELATGVAVAGNILAVTNRHMGCELFDISSPKAPVRVGHFLCGEAQSVCFFGRYAAIGDWMNKQVRIFDISDTNDIKAISIARIDGFADGVCSFMRDGRRYCVVASGHHSAKLKNRRKYERFTYVTSQMLEDGYGCGHGITILDVTNPHSPEFVSEIKTPPLFGGPDTWRVYTDGEQIVFTDSMNGVFVISAENVREPRIVNSYKLSALGTQYTSPPSIQVQTAAITSAATVNGLLCVASEQCGVHILKPDMPLGKMKEQSIEIKSGKKTRKKDVFYSSCGQIHAFAQYGDKVYCAAGNCGIEVVDREGNFLERKATKGICRDIIAYGERLVTAESDGGIAVYDIENGLSEICRIPSKEMPIRQVLKTKDGLVAVCGTSKILFFTEDGRGFSLSDEIGIRGILYHRHLMPAPNGEGVVANPLATGPVILTKKNGKIDANIVFSEQYCPFADGACGYRDKLVSIFQGKYYLLDAPYTKETAKVTDTCTFDGQAFALGENLVLLNRYSGGVTLLDASTPENPKIAKETKLSSHPEFSGFINGEIYTACGFDGIVRI